METESQPLSGSISDLDDIARVLSSESDPKSVLDAACRLLADPNPDARAMGAQALVQNSLAGFALLKDIILAEQDHEVRGWLYIAMSMQRNRDADVFIENIGIERNTIMDAQERLYFLAAKSILRGSREFLLDMMKFIYHPEIEISNLSIMLCNMLISDESKIEKSFLKLLESEIEVKPDVEL